MQSNTKSKRIFYFDALRALAIIMVIIFHISVRADSVNTVAYNVIPSYSWLVHDFMRTCCRCGVDIFLMLSGALSLGRDWSIRSFLGKRIPRIVYPFLFWGILLAAIIFVAIYYFPVLDWPHDFSFDLYGFFYFLGNSLIGQNHWFGHYWFFWMILGTYLIMPIFNNWIRASPMDHVEYFLVIWAITCLYDKTLFWNLPIKLSYFMGPIGMVVLGYYLRHTKRKVFNNVYYSFAFLIAGVFLLMFISYLLSGDSDPFYTFDRYSIFLVIEVIGIFTLYKNFSQLNLNLNFIKNPDGIFRRSILSIAKYSYGIYLCHQFFMNIFLVMFGAISDFKLLAFLLFVFTLASSWLTMDILNRVP
uniref:acyltransferase n=1 Tax=Methanobrevibacter sp. TaxID=66852 RepID=UPI00388FC0A0